MATVRFFAAARAAAGVAVESVPAGSVAELVAALSDRDQRLARVLRSCSYLVDGLACHNRAAPLSATSTVDVLPPFAGG